MLGLSHALNIAFFTALAESGEAAPRLARCRARRSTRSSTSPTRVAGENPDLYYEIQSLNDYGEESLQRAASTPSSGCIARCASTTRRRSPR